MPASDPRRIALSWSTGKDCAWALHVLRQDPHREVIALLTTLAPDHTVSMHGVPETLLDAQAAAVGLPVVKVRLPAQPCPNAAYETAMCAALAELRARRVDAVAFGDLYLEDIRAYREAKMRDSGLGIEFPLWGSDTTELARQTTGAGLRAVLTSVDLRVLPADYAGREYDAALLAELPAGIDPCGENGEFHSFAHAGPMFAHAVSFERGATRRDGDHAHLEVRTAVERR